MTHLTKDTRTLPEQIRLAVPEAARLTAQLVVDNPGPMVLLAASTIVATRAALNIVRPRSIIEALALALVLDVGLTALTMKAAETGLLRLRVRDEGGQLIPFPVTAA